MQNYQHTEDRADRLKSGIITAAVWASLLLFLFWYKVTENIPEKKEVETRMLINFGDNRNGNGTEEPANQEGSIAASSISDNSSYQEISENTVTKNSTQIPIPQKETEKIITGKNDRTVVKQTENSTSKTVKNSPQISRKSSGNSGNISKNSQAKGDRRGKEAIGNFLKGRGTNPGSQGNGTGPGNAGDPLGGEGNGDSKIGIDRRLTGFIPGTMGRGGQKPSNSCNADGEIRISYKVDKAGNVISARRSGGISDPCAVSAAISWVKRYVKAERASTSSTGVYSITF